MKFFKKVSIVIGIIVVFVYMLNIGAIFFISHGTDSTNVKHFSNYSTLSNNLRNFEVVNIKGKVGPKISVLAKGKKYHIDGYVDFVSSDPKIYVSSTGKKIIQSSYADEIVFYSHEYTHILQKRYLAFKAGGYPSWWNPVVSFKYYYELFKLNNYVLSKYGKVNWRSTRLNTIVSGLEIQAECGSQYLSGISNAGVWMNYLNNSGCKSKKVLNSIRTLHKFDK